VLSGTEKRRLVEQGYLVLPGLVPMSRVDDALRAINGSLGERGIAPERLPKMRATSYCPELVSAPEIVGLYTETGLGAAAEAALGAGKVQRPTKGQIALRFPQSGPPQAASPHIDGMYTPDNGVPEGTIYHFTALGAVFLSDAVLPNAGNFTVWPGSHRLLEEHFRKEGPASLLRGFPKVPLPAPEPVLVRAGDAVLAHYLLAHGIAPNVSPHIRYAVFFASSPESMG
jgi:hypothetical protein